jgi:hypothetical protein
MKSFGFRASKPFLVVAGICVMQSLGAAQTPQANANFARLLQTSPSARCTLNSVGNVCVVDQGVITLIDGRVGATPTSNAEVLQVAGAVITSFPGGVIGQPVNAIRGKVKDIKIDPSTMRFPVKWVGTTSVVFPVSYQDSTSGLVSETLAYWSPSTGVGLLSLCDFSSATSDSSLLQWDATETGSWACVGGSSDTGFALTYSRGLLDPVTSLPFPLFAAQPVQVFGQKPSAINPFNILDFRCVPGRGVMFTAIPSDSKDPVAILSTSKTATLSFTQQAPYKRTSFAGRDLVGLVDANGSLVLTGQIEGTVASTPERTFDGEVACSLNGTLVAFTSNNGQGPFEAVNPVKGVGVVIKGNKPPSAAERLRPSDVLVNDDGTVCWTERDDAGASLYMHNGAQRSIVLQTGQRLFNSTLVGFNVSKDQNLNNRNTVAVTYTLRNGQSGVMTVSLDCPILRSIDPVQIPASGKDATIVLRGDRFDPDGGDEVTVTLPSGRSLKTRTKSNSTNERSITLTLPGDLLTQEGAITLKVTRPKNSQSSEGRPLVTIKISE